MCIRDSDQVARVSRGRRSKTATTVEDVLAVGSLELPEPSPSFGDPDAEMVDQQDGDPVPGPSNA